MTTMMIIKMIKMAPTAPPAAGAIEPPLTTPTPGSVNVAVETVDGLGIVGGTGTQFVIKRKIVMKSDVIIFLQENVQTQFANMFLFNPCTRTKIYSVIKNKENLCFIDRNFNC